MRDFPWHPEAPPQISVIVSVHNGEEYLGRCLESLRVQTLQDMEILCVDDGSSDGTPVILEAAALRDPRLRILRHSENRGLGATRNTAIAAARAPYIGAVDADDYVAPEMFADLLHGTANGYFDVVACGFARVDLFGTVLERSMTKMARHEVMPPGLNIFTAVNPAFWNKIWRRSLFTDNDILFPERLYYEDGATTPLVMFYVRSLHLIGGSPYSYVQRPGSIIHSFSDRHIIEYLRVLDRVKDGLIERGAYLEHKSLFNGYALGKFAYLARNIASNPHLSLVEKRDLMRHVALIGESYVAHDDALRSLPAAPENSIASFGG